MSWGYAAAGSVGPDRGRRGLYVLVFAVTGAVIYLCGMKAAQSTRPMGDVSPSATAVLRAETSLDARALADSLTQVQVEFEQTLFADSNLSPLLAKQPTLSTAFTPRQLREHLSLVFAAGHTVQEVQATITFQGAPSIPSVALVNALAEQCAEAWRNRQRSQSDARYVAAREAADRAQQALGQSQANLSGFLERYFRTLETLAQDARAAADRAVAATAAAPQAKPITGGVPSGPEQPRMVENPQWTALREEVVQQRQTLRAMLEHRTREHPEVQKLQAVVADLERSLETIPRQVAEDRPAAPLESKSQSVAETSPLPAATPQPRPMVEQSPDEAVEAAQSYRTLQSAVSQAEAQQLRLAQAEREAWQQQQRTAAAELLLASLPTVEAAGFRGMQLSWIAVAAATAVAAGAGMIANGVQRDPLLSTPDQLARTTSLPVLGLIRERNLPSEMVPSTAAQAAGWWLSGGLALIICSLISVVMIFGVWMH